MLRRALGTVRAEVRGEAERHSWDSPLTEAALRQQTSSTLCLGRPGDLHDRGTGRHPGLMDMHSRHP